MYKIKRLILIYNIVLPFSPSLLICYNIVFILNRFVSSLDYYLRPIRHRNSLCFDATRNDCAIEARQAQFSTGREERIVKDERGRGEGNRRSCQRSAMHLPLTRAAALDRGSRGVPFFFPTMTHHFVTIIAIIRGDERKERERDGERARFNARASRTHNGPIYPYTVSTASSHRRHHLWT